MRSYSYRTFTFFLLFSLSYHLIFAQNVSDTRLLSNPAISENNIVFVYAEDLWIADKDGSNPRRLTIDEGIESNPVFSPDGSTIAFSAQYDGNTDVFVIPATGGIPKRLTWHPSSDYVRDFSPDGEKVLFASQRNSHTNRFVQLYTIKVSGGLCEQLPIPTAFHATYSPDGKYIAYTPLGDRFTQWKNYRGGTQSRIWIYNIDNHEVEEIPKPRGGSNDSDPQWISNKVYFKSDRNGEFNIYSYNPDNKAVTQHTDYDDFSVMSLTSSRNELIYDQSGYLHIFDPVRNSSSKLIVGIATDLLELRPRFVSGANYIRSISISPSGARAVMDFRGEIITAPGKKGDPFNLTNTPGVHEKNPKWSADGKQIAYFSDASGEYALHIQSVNDRSLKKFILTGTGFYADLNWSPDSKKLSYVDNGRNLYVLDIQSKETIKIGSDELYIPGPFRELFGSWSYDSKWISYTIITDTNFERAYLFSLEKKQSYPLSDGLSNVSEPTFDPSGKYVYMLASTDAGPVVNWFDQSNQDMEMSNSIYLITLQKDLISPLAKESDEEEGTSEEESENGESSSDNKKNKSKKKNEDLEKETDEIEFLKIDWEGIENRIIALPIEPGNYYNIHIPEEGQIYYMSMTPHSGYGELQSIRHFDLKEKKDTEIMKANWFIIAAGGKKMLYRSGQSWGITDVGKKPENGALNIGAIQVKIDPIKEWENIFNEAWRVNRDYFYDPGMHGLDWEATREKYKVFLPDLSCRSDLYKVMEWMFSELSVGHHRFQGRGDQLNSPDRISGGLLGADYEVDNNRYRFTKIYGGLNWTPELRSPLTEPGINVKEGEYLLEVNGKNLTAGQNLYSFFENTADKILEITVGPNADNSDSRTVKVVPISNETSLRHRDWVEGNLRKVHESTNGQVAYVYVPNTAGAGHEYFKRYFYPQVNKKAVIIDERYNGGGQLADYYIDILKKPYQAHWNFRYGKDLKAPNASIQGPKVMIIDETAGSGGDYLPFLFRKFELGTLIGKRTWGGLVGVLGYPQFIDGGSVTAPNVAFWNEDGFRIENEGIAPDIEVEQWPKEVIDGHDPQLEKAIEVVMEELRKNPPQEPVRPDYPVRIRK